MIEVEQKFILSERDVEKLTEGSEFLGERTFTDIYYDSADLALGKNDMWLRERDGNWELKIPMHEIGKNVTQQYQEIEGEEKIREVFGIAPMKDFLNDITDLGYEPICNLTTVRKKFRKGKFVIDLDQVSGNDGFNYQIGEIELMVEDKNEALQAIVEIGKFAENAGLKVAPVRGKVIEYLRIKKSEHYKSLVEAGVVA